MFTALRPRLPFPPVVRRKDTYIECPTQFITRLAVYDGKVRVTEAMTRSCQVYDPSGFGVDVSDLGALL